MNNLEHFLNQADENFNVFESSNIYKTLTIKDTLFPYQTMQFELSKESLINTINDAFKKDENVFIVQQKVEKSQLLPKDICKVGTLAKIKQIVRLNNITMRITVVGIKRMVVESIVCYSPMYEAFLKDFKVEKEDKVKLAAIKSLLSTKLEEFSQFETKYNELFSVINLEETEKSVSTLVMMLYKDEKEKQKLLEMKRTYDQYEELYKKIIEHIQIIKVSQDIQYKVNKNIEKLQKEVFLKEQLKVINEELGEDFDEIQNYKDKINKSKMLNYAKEKCLNEIKRLEKLGTQSAEASVIRNYLDTILALPWTSAKIKSIDIRTAKNILNEQHYGLGKVKERILEYLAVYRMTNKLKSPILCLVGPPGVGKTSIAQSIAKAANRKFVSMSLAGLNDVSEIRGHRRTYIGAMPGRIINSLLNIKVNNPVFLLDEIDKMSSDFRGDPASAMLELLDPNQNSIFQDNFLDMPFDLSSVMFVATANYIDNIPLPLLDRMEIIELSGYTHEEKIKIEKEFIIPRRLEANGLKNYKICIDDLAIDKIINNYTRESGVRALEKNTDTIFRKIAVDILEMEKNSQKDIVLQKEYNINVDNLKDYLGIEKYDTVQISDYDQVGTVNGLAWTSVGGKLLNVEVCITDNGKGDIQLTGSLGDVMKESCRTAITVVKSFAKDYDIDMEKFNKCDFHVHFPAGSTPKDGPSAGITIVTAMVSALTKKHVHRDIAMTGEISLRGKVLPIGGLKEKLLAAYSAGIKKVIIPVDNKKDLQEIPKEALDNLKILLADNIKIVLDASLKM